MSWEHRYLNHLKSYLHQGHELRRQQVIFGNCCLLNLCQYMLIHSIVMVFMQIHFMQHIYMMLDIDFHDRVCIAQMPFAWLGSLYDL